MTDISIFVYDLSEYCKLNKNCSSTSIDLIWLMYWWLFVFVVDNDVDNDVDNVVGVVGLCDLFELNPLL